jgi:hypothetical protein
MKLRVRAILFLVVGLLLLAPVAAAPEDATKIAPTAPTGAPSLGPFLNIWLDDVGNFEPAVAYNSRRDEFLVVWSNTRSGGATKDIYARRLSGNGTLRSYFTISHNANFHNYEPDVAYSPIHDEYLVVFTYNSSVTGPDIWARRVKWDGSWMSSEFALGRKTDSQHDPAVTYNSDADEYLVVYQNTWAGGGRDIDAERVRASDGTPLGWVNVAAGGGQFRSAPDVTYNPASNLYLIAYTFQSGGSADIFGKVASWNFGDVSPEIHICDDPNGQANVAVAADGGEYLAVWEDLPNVSTSELYARRLAPDGTPLGPGGGFWITGAHNRYDEAPSVTGGASFGYLIVWQRFMGGLDFNIYGRYVSRGRDHAHGSEYTVDGDAGAQMMPGVACSAVKDCLIVEEDNSGPGGDFDIQGRLAYSYPAVYLPVVVR